MARLAQTLGLVNERDLPCAEHDLRGVSRSLARCTNPCGAHSGPKACRNSAGPVFIITGTSKNMGSVRADQRDPLRQLKWMEPRAKPGAIFRGALT